MSIALPVLCSQGHLSFVVLCFVYYLSSSSFAAVGSFFPCWSLSFFSPFCLWVALHLFQDLGNVATNRGNDVTGVQARLHASVP